MAGVIGLAVGIILPAPSARAALYAATPADRKSELTSPESTRPGTVPLDERGSKGSLLYVPSSVRADRPSPLLVVLHGAGGEPRHVLDLLMRHADAQGVILLAPKSIGPSWDYIKDSRFGDDLARLEAAFERVRAQFTLDKRGLAVAGFSDGASYALALGTAPGSSFRRVVAFSPGFLPPYVAPNKTQVFISHGQNDDVLPIALTSRRIVPRLRSAGYDVEYLEFRGGHVIPSRIVHQAIAWLALPHDLAARD